MINISEEAKNIIIKELKPLLKKNDYEGVLKVLRPGVGVNNEVFEFLITSGVPLLEHMKEIPEYRFTNTKLTSVTIPSNIEKICKNAFYNSKLSKIILSEGLGEIESEAFRFVENLSSVHIPEGITQLRPSTFSNCPNLTSVYLPDSLTVLGMQVFKECNNDVEVFASSRKNMPANKKLKCPQSEIDWYKEHLKVIDYSTGEVKESLNEAWGKDVPNWLKKGLNQAASEYDRDKYTSNPEGQLRRKLERSNINTYSASDMANYNDKKYGTPNTIYREYQRPRGSFENDSDRALFNKLMNAGFDLSSNDLKITEGEAPTSKKDPRIVEPNVGIWFIPLERGNYQIYASGMNELEKLLRKPTLGEAGGKYVDVPFKGLPIKYLAEIASHFCWIDGSSKENRDFNKLRVNREKFSSDHKENVLQGKERASKQEKKRYAFKNTDKSGYVVIPSSKKYADALKKMGLKNAAEDLSNLDKEINEIYSKYQAYAISLDKKQFIDTYSGYNSSQSKKQATLANSLKAAIACYEDALREYNKVASNYSEGTPSFIDSLYDSYFSSYVDRAKTNIESIYRNCGDILFSTIDF